MNSIFTSNIGVRAALLAGGALPASFTRKLGTWAADRLASRKSSPMVRAVRANQWVVRGERLSTLELEQAVRDVFRQSAVGLADLYHAFRRPEELLRLAPRFPEMDALIRRSQEKKNPAVVVISHSSNFDLFLLAHSMRGLAGQVLTYAQPTGGYQIQNEIRAAHSSSIQVTPINQRALRMAIENLRHGGTVYTGVDRPEDTNGMELSFFGRSAWLPVGHVRLAMKVGVPIIVIAVFHSPDGFYRALISEPLAMEVNRDPRLAIKQNAQQVLDVLSGFILRAPEQWLMFYPVWPEALKQMP